MRKNQTGFSVFPGILLFSLLILISGELISQSRLYNAVMDNNRSRTNRYLSRGDNPNGDGNPQYIPLIGAAEVNHYRIAVILVENNANVNIQNHIGFTPLMEATIQRNRRIMNFLINNGADLELQANNGATALIVAVNANNTREARMLLENGAEPNTTDMNGVTPLMRAMHIGDNIELVNLLVEHEAHMDERNPEGKPVIMIYPYRNRIPAHQELIRLGADVNIQDKEGQTPLIKAVLEGNLEMVKILIENEADPHIKDNTGASALDYALVQMEIREYFDSLKE